jgi:hypothetical protein
MKLRSIPLASFLLLQCGSNSDNIMLPLESGKLLYLPDPCFYCRISTGRHLSWNHETAHSLVSSLLRCCTNGTEITAFQLASLPHSTYLAKETTTASLKAWSFIRQRRRLHLHPPVEPFWAAAHAWQGGLANDMVAWVGKWQRKGKSGLPRQAFTSEQEPDVLKPEWLHTGKLRLPTPLSSVSRAHLLGGMERSVLSQWRTYPQCRASIMSKYWWRLQWHEYL